MSRGLPDGYLCWFCAIWRLVIAGCPNSSGRAGLGHPSIELEAACPFSRVQAWQAPDLTRLRAPILRSLWPVAALC
jgi:hypothetical protein